MSEEEYSKNTVSQLKQMIEERGATPNGKKKADFVQQLLELGTGGTAPAAQETPNGTDAAPEVAQEPAEPTTNSEESSAQPETDAAAPATSASDAQATPSAPTPAPAPDAEAEKRAARAARFGIPIASTPTPKPTPAPAPESAATAPSAALVASKKEPKIDAVKPVVDEETLRKRRERFGAVEPVVAPAKKEKAKEAEKKEVANGDAKEAKVVEKKEAAPVDPETAERLRLEAEKRAARAARFGNPTESTKVSLEDEDKKRKAEEEPSGESSEKKAKID